MSLRTSIGSQPEPTVMNGGAAVRLTYEIRVRGELTDALLAALEPLGLHVEQFSNGPILVGVFRDQAELHGALQAMQDLGVELVEIRQRAGWTRNSTASSMEHGAFRGSTSRLSPRRGQGHGLGSP